jgi:hypothetical protein
VHAAVPLAGMHASRAAASGMAMTIPPAPCVPPLGLTKPPCPPALPELPPLLLGVIAPPEEQDPPVAMSAMHANRHPVRWPELANERQQPLATVRVCCIFKSE